MEKDAKRLAKMIDTEFPYTRLSEEKISERLKKDGTFIFKKSLGKSIAGFVDLEIRKNTGFINGVSVKKNLRKKGIGKELVEFAIEFLKSNGAKKASLLVKRDNEAAKRLYSSQGFFFLRFHDKKIDDSIVEVWEREFPRKNEAYLN